MSAARRVLITGAGGLLGAPTAAVFAADPGVEVLAATHRDLDITDDEQVAARIDAFDPDVVINCAAYTKVDDCEANEALATRINADAAGRLARRAAERGARFVHISTDYVFGGDASRPYPEDDPTAPPESLSAYGRSKLAGERRVQAACEGALIVRTAWVYGLNGACFPNTILRLARERPRLQVVNDQRGSPTYASDLAAALHRLAMTDVKGIIHVTNAGTCTWFEFACEILRQAGIDMPIDPVTTDAFPRPARRPAYSVLDNGRYNRLTGEPLRDWRLALRDYLAARA